MTLFLILILIYERESNVQTMAPPTDKCVYSDINTKTNTSLIHRIRMMVLYSLTLLAVFTTSLCLSGSFNKVVEDDMAEVLSTIHTIQTAGFPQCQQAVYFHPAWSSVASIVKASNYSPIILVDSTLSLGPSTKIPVVTRPPGTSTRQEWCVGWTLLLDNPGQLQSVVDMIRSPLINSPVALNGFMKGLS